VFDCLSNVLKKGLSMATMTKSEMETKLSKVIENTLSILEDLHIVHKDDPIEKLLTLPLPFGTDMTVSKLLVSLYDILEPVIDLARKQFPALFFVIDWLEDIITKLLGD
jgi:hypothetical protein